jgi:hypothetical protein
MVKQGIHKITNGFVISLGLTTRECPLNAHPPSIISMPWGIENSFFGRLFIDNPLPIEEGYYKLAVTLIYARYYELCLFISTSYLHASERDQSSPPEKVNSFRSTIVMQLKSSLNLP